jgi:hypothetical protein
VLFLSPVPVSLGHPSSVALDAPDPSFRDCSQLKIAWSAAADGRLFRVAVDYDREQTKGLIDADMVEAISAVYDPQVKPSVSRRRQGPSVCDDPGTPIAQWGNADNSVMLYRLSSYATSLRLVVTAEPIAALARAAAARALVLDAREAPQREAAREKKEAEDRRAAEERVRSTNKATFRP